MKDKIIWLSRSMPANIADNFRHHHRQANSQSFLQDSASIYKTIEHFHTALDEEYIDTNSHPARMEEIRTATHIQNGDIRYLATRT